MKKIIASFAIIGAALWTPYSIADSGVIAVIVNPSNPVTKLDQGDLRPIFQTSKTTWPNGDKIVAFNLSEEDAIRQDADLAMLGLDAERVARYWVDRKIRGGNAAPKKAPSVAVMVKLVASQTGGIGYVPLSEVSKDVKVIAKIQSGVVKAP